ncbi:hypothetical protein KR054_012286, partial [Drosophila jambulina]
AIFNAGFHYPALLFGYLQISSMVGARVTSQVHRRPNATHFTPAHTHGGTYNQSAYRSSGPVVTNFTRAAVAPNWSVPAKTYQPALQAPPTTQNQGFYGAPGPVGVPAQAAYGSSGWVASNYSQPSGWFLPNTPQGQVGTPAVVVGSHGNGTFYPTSNQTAFGGRGKSNNPYANLSI